MSGAYYNENDPYAAQWLRNLIAAGEIPAGDVDERSIVDVRGDDLAGYVQCHFFAGIGGWGLALRLAGWPDSRPIWTGSCPCQPFSTAGKGAGTDDPRHLWPHFMDLIAAGRPPVVMGEQVAGQAGYGWLDGVRADLAREGYASRGVDIPACAVDAPHIRQRLYWIAVADGDCGRALPARSREGAGGDRQGDAGQGAGPHDGMLADAKRTRSTPDGRYAGEVGELSEAQRRAEYCSALPGGVHAALVGCVADSDCGGRAGRPEDQERSAEQGADAERAIDRSQQLWGDACGAGLAVGSVDHLQRGDVRQEGTALGAPVDGGRGRNMPRTFWSDYEPLRCHDGKTRRTQPGLPLLAHGVRGRVALGGALGAQNHPQADHLINRVGAWRGFGNAIVPQEAAEIVAAWMEVTP